MGEGDLIEDKVRLTGAREEGARGLSNPRTMEDRALFSRWVALGFVSIFQIPIA